MGERMNTAFIILVIGFSLFQGHVTEVDDTHIGLVYEDGVYECWIPASVDECSLMMDECWSEERRCEDE